MPKKLLHTGLFVLLSIFFFGCPGDNNLYREGYKPIYLEDNLAKKVYSTDPIPMQKPGKSVFDQHFLYINEQLKGIHVLDNSDPTNPTQLAFWHIPGNLDMAFYGNMLYADNATDLVVINVNDIYNIREISRDENVYEQQAYPSQTDVEFECVDPNKGVVIGWEFTELKKPLCFR